MTLEIPGILTLLILGGMITVLALELFNPVATVISVLCIFVLTGILSPDQALSGFSNPNILIIASLALIVGALQNAGGLTFLVNALLGGARSYRSSLAKIIFPTAFLSAFMNNTPIVMVFTPILRKWALQNKLFASKFLMPLCFATILGGVCTLIGTSTNLVVNGVLLENNFKPFGMFEFSNIGIPCAIVGCLYLFFFSGKFLPARRDPLSRALTGEYRDYVLEAVVEPNCPLVGTSIRDAHLRHLSGLYLAKIERGGELIGPVGPDEILRAKDRLIFIGMIHAIKELQEIPNLRIASDAHYTPQKDKGGLLVEAVVSHSAAIVNKTVREADFRSLYGAVVIAVHRNSERIESKIGDIVIRAGDTLLLDTTEDFLRDHAESRDFYLASRLEERRVFAPQKALITLLTLIGVVIVGIVNDAYFFHATFAAIPILIFTKCLNVATIKKHMDWELLVFIAVTIGIGKALESSGTAKFIAYYIVQIFQGLGPAGLLAGIYLVTWLLTSVMSNNATAVMMFPVAVSAAQAMGLDPRPFIIALTIASSICFFTPIGYQCNLIVYGAGGYKFSDFVKFGLPLDILVGATAVTMLALVYGVH